MSKRSGFARTSDLDSTEASRSTRQSTTDGHIAPGIAAMPTRFVALAAFLAVPALYAIGVAYWDAWLQAHGLPSSAFPLALDEALFKGYEAILMLLTSWLTLLLPSWSVTVVALIVLWIFAALLLAAWSIISAYVFASLSVAAKFLIGRLRKIAPAINLAARSYAIASIPFLAGGLVLYALLLLIVPILIGQYSGRYVGERSAEKIHRRIETGRYEAGDRFVVFSTEKTVNAFLITCSAYGCGVMKEEGASFVVWDQIAKIDPHKAKQSEQAHEAQ